MYPKTFRVRIYHPFGPMTKSLETSNSYMFRIHSSDFQETLNWVARVFPGVDLQYKSESTYRIGNTDPISIIDCDVFKKRGYLDGKRVEIETPEGFFRVSSEEVANGLFRLIEKINEDYKQCLRIIKNFNKVYRKSESEYHLKRIIEAKKGIHYSKVWMGNLMNEYLSIQYADQ